MADNFFKRLIGELFPRREAPSWTTPILGDSPSISAPPTLGELLTGKKQTTTVPNTPPTLGELLTRREAPSWTTSILGDSPSISAPLATGLPAYDARYSLSPEERQLQDQEPFIGSPFDNPDVGGRIPSWRGTPQGPTPELEKTYSPLTEGELAKAALDAQKAKEEAAKAEAESQKRWEAALAGLAALEPKANIPIHAPSLQQVQPTVVRGGSSQAPTNIPMPTFTKQNTAPRILKFLR